MRRATLPVLVLLMLLSPPWSAVLAQGASDVPSVPSSDTFAIRTSRADIDKAVSAVSSMYNHAFSNDGKVPLSGPLSGPPGYDRWLEVSIHLPDDVAAQLERCVDLLLAVWDQSGDVERLHAAARQAYGEESTRLHEEGNQLGGEAMRRRVEARGCIDAAVLEIYMAYPRARP